MPKVTVALITYNRPDYLKQAIDAIICQTYKDFELIIMDNGSTSDTQDLVRPYLNQQVSYVRNLINNREYMNTAFSVGTGEYLIITHDDDMMMPRMLEKEVEILDNDNDCVLVGCNTTIINEEGIVLNKRFNRHYTNRKFKQFEYIKSFFSDELILLCPTILLRRSFFNSNNLNFKIFEVGPAADNYLWFEVNLHHFNLVTIAEPLYYYRIHKKQDSVANSLTMELSMFLKTLDLLKTNLPSDRAKPYLKIVITKLIYTAAFAFKYGKITRHEFNTIILKHKTYLRNEVLISFSDRCLFFSLHYFFSFTLFIRNYYVYFKKL